MLLLPFLLQLLLLLLLPPWLLLLLGCCFAVRWRLVAALAVATEAACSIFSLDENLVVRSRTGLDAESISQAWKACLVKHGVPCGNNCCKDFALTYIVVAWCLIGICLPQLRCKMLQELAHVSV